VIKIGINGFGRIGRNVLRAFLDQAPPGLEVIAINDPFQDVRTSAHLLKYDTMLGELKGKVDHCADAITIEGKRLLFSAEKEPSACPWSRHGIDIVVECSGAFTEAAKARDHISAQAKKVLISAPATGEDITVVLGVNEDCYDSSAHQIISNASCTTNCLAPLAKVIDDEFGIENGLMTTIHSYTRDQRLLDTAHKDLRRARAAALSIIPASSGAAKAIGQVLPHLAGKLNGFAFRVPTPNVSVVDLVATVRKDADVASVNNALRNAAQNGLSGILGYSDLPLVSRDFCGSKLSSIVDTELTMVMDQRLIKVVAWYDNEWAFSNRLVELATLVASQMDHS
jgi:glyceraldehyde 3-phosphate dehydrogenase